MAMHTLSVCEWVLLAGCGTASLYAMVAALAMPFFAARRAGVATRGAHSAAAQPTEFPSPHVGVSVLKPLCGAEPRLFE
ncbi:MAG: ceramide glucosyltransferase, partial [Caballeronia sp.]|nr:ceramide glucosyltransferase [Caballeronia sp.]